LRQIKLHARGTVRQALRFKDLCKINLTIPDYNDQKNLYKKISTVENETINFNKEIDNQLKLVAQLRHAFLCEAMRGNLVAQNSNDEPASELLKIIKAEKEKLIAEGKLKKQNSLPEIKLEEIPYEIPKGWMWCRLGEIGNLKRGKSKYRPRNAEILFEHGKYPFIQTGDVSRAKFTNDIITTINSYYNDFGLRQSEIQKKGTLCITIAAHIAECGFLGFDSCVPDSIVCFVALNKTIEKYIYYYVKVAKEELEKFAPATAQKNINLGILNILAIPFPSLAEQQRIVSKLEQLMQLCDDLEKIITQSREQTNLLLHAVLRETLEERIERIN
jgi:type I restriction enzyme S subunit